MLSKWRHCRLQVLSERAIQVIQANKLHLVDKKNTKSDIWKYFALRFTVIFISLLLNQGFNYFNAKL